MIMMTQLYSCAVKSYAVAPVSTCLFQWDWARALLHILVVCKVTMGKLMAEYNQGGIA